MMMDEWLLWKILKKVSKALKLLKTHTYDEVAKMTGITKSTLVRNNPYKRKLNRNK